MKAIVIITMLAVIAASASSCSTEGDRLTPAGTASAVSTDDIKGESFQLERVYLVSVNIPDEDVTRVLDSLTSVVPLVYGKYDRVAFRSASGVEQFRPLSGSRAGAQEELSEYETVRVSFSIPQDPETLRKTIDAIRNSHPYEEPVINVQEGWTSRATGKEDETNPNRWWNRDDN
jgi:hypothetical protein